MESAKFKMIKRFYNMRINGKRLWDESRVSHAVSQGVITASEYQIIVGKPYNVDKK